MADEIPVACCLSDEELRNREATLLAEFKFPLVTTEELPDGYLFRIPGDPSSGAPAEFRFGKLLKRLVGERGFEPLASWSRNKGALPG